MGKSKEKHLKDFLFEQYKLGNVDWVGPKKDRRTIKGQREPKNITEGLLELFFQNYVFKFTKHGALTAAMKTKDFKIIYNMKLKSLEKNLKHKTSDPKKWFARVVDRAYPTVQHLDRAMIKKYGPLFLAAKKKIKS